MEDLIRAIQDLGQYAFWDYILFGANVISVIISAFALFAAIRVPKKIAENQNKIALFEKRYECFQFFEKCYLFGKALKNNENRNDMKKDCLILFDINVESIDLETLSKKLHHFEYMLHQMEFLFPGLKEESVNSLFKALYSAVISIFTNENIEESVSNYIANINDFVAKYNKTIWDKLYLVETK